MFKQNMYDLFDELKGNHSRIGVGRETPFPHDKVFQIKLADAE